MFAVLTKNLHHQVGGPVHDISLIGKFRYGINQAMRGYNLFDYMP